MASFLTLLKLMERSLRRCSVLSKTLLQEAQYFKLDTLAGGGGEGGKGWSRKVKG